MKVPTISGTPSPIKAGKIYGKFTPSPTRKIGLIDKDGKLIKIVPMNRAQRRRAQIGR